MDPLATETRSPSSPTNMMPDPIDLRGHAVDDIEVRIPDGLTEAADEEMHRAEAQFRNKCQGFGSGFI